MEEVPASHFRLPCRAEGRSTGVAGLGWLMDECYAARGPDLELGWPLPETLCALGLGEAASELQGLRPQAGRTSEHGKTDG